MLARQLSEIGRRLVAVVLLVVYPNIVSGGEVVQSPTERTIQFLTNAHTGVLMNDSEWLSANARNTEKFTSFGGLSRLVTQTTAFARAYGGLKSVTILDVTVVGKSHRIRAEVKFLDEPRRKKSPAAAEREDIVWVFLAAKEEGSWKLTF